MVFDLRGKVAIITGGASGIGLRYAKALIKNGVKGVTLADIDPQFGKTALEQIENEFGPGKAVFIKTDVTNMKQFEDAFKKTIETFKNVDILFNNAGILNDAVWEKEIAINVNGVIHGMLLGMENYLQKYRQGPEAVIVNISSIAGIAPFNVIPVYCATKSAVFALSRAWGTPEHYERTKVRVIAICPGVTDTPLITEMSGRNLGEPYQRILNDMLNNLAFQKPEYLASQVVNLVRNSENGTVWVIEASQKAYQFIMPERSTMVENE